MCILDIIGQILSILYVMGVVLRIDRYKSYVNWKQTEWELGYIEAGYSKVMIPERRPGRVFVSKEWWFYCFLFALQCET